MKTIRSLTIILVGWLAFLMVIFVTVVMGWLLFNGFSFSFAEMGYGSFVGGFGLGYSFGPLVAIVIGTKARDYFAANIWPAEKKRDASVTDTNDKQSVDLPSITA